MDHALYIGALAAVMKTDRNSLGAAVGRIPSGCSILTARDGARRSGMLASWVQQASFEPLAVSVCIKKGRPIAELVHATNCFLLNVVGEDPTLMFKHFGKGFSLEQDAFQGIETEATEFGPAIKRCIAFLGCAVLDRVSAGDHDLFIAEVQAAEVRDRARPYVHVRNSGLSY